MTISRRTTLKALGAVGAGVAMSGTALAVGEHDDDERPADDAPGADEAPDAVAAVRVAHFAPDAPNVDVYVDDDQVLADVPYDDVSPYLELEPGTYTITITAAGDPDTVAFEDEVSFGRAFYTVAAIGELEADTFRPLVLTDAGSALVRLAHASPDAPAVDVIGSEGAPTLFQNVSFGEATNYVALPAGSYTVDVLPAGEDGPEADAGGEAPDHDENDYDENDYDENDYDENDHDDDAEMDDDPDAVEETDADAVATVDLDLEEGTAYTAYATGYLETEGDDPEFALNVTVDGPVAGEEPAEDEPDEPAPDDDPDDEYDDDPDDPDDEYDDDPDDPDDEYDDDHDDHAEDDHDEDEKNGYDDHDENGNDD
ncbi:DUF4397 domain-containing protein [Natronobiforma cellulositropha]|uniref:DUF4397 domain-containing protein n=1 Tax=Natronobiforma cellulositropha TaxID=1679076 RepID=UPI0021D57C52|nr:DUF4397 domain-containing protein [Natronobiforma cellulositropha]